MASVPVEEIVRRVEDLPSLPQVVHRVIRLTEDPRATAADVSNAISCDQSLAANVLKLANSAYYGFARRIGTITEAVIILGFNTVRSLAFACSVYDVFKADVEGYSLARGELWKHSLACAMASRLVARRIKFRSPDQAFIAGLLHDIGKVILNFHVGASYEEIIRNVGEGGASFQEAERAVLGYSHSDVGARVAEKWSLPEDLVAAIGYHHEPASAPAGRGLTAVVHVADAIVLSLGIGIGRDQLYYNVDGGILGQLGLKENDIEELVSSLGSALVDLENMIL